jgi:23S rRNA pseudouridine1911/1915/1917 synthase
LVQGVLAHERGTIDAPIGRDPRDRQAMAVTERNGKQAVTHFDVMERFREHTAVRLQLETGRTHQIRVHMKYIGHPLVGDPKYGSRKSPVTNNGENSLSGQALHAETLGFVHPVTGQKLHFEVPMPQDMQSLFEWLRLRDG